MRQTLEEDGVTPLTVPEPKADGLLLMAKYYELKLWGGI